MTTKQTRAKNEKECLAYCLGLSDDPEFQKAINDATHEQRVVFLFDNGFTAPDLTEEEAIVLEDLYREKAKHQEGVN